MISSVLHGIWRWCPLHQLLGKVDRAVRFRKGSAMIEGSYSVSASHHGSTKEGESTLLPMLIAGLVAVVIGITIAAFFV
jgi:hypothetical protein